jgi:chromate transporter
VALVALAAWRIGRKSLTAVWTVVVAIAALAALAAGAPFPAVVAVAGVIGWLMPAGGAKGTAAAPASEPVANSTTGAPASVLRHAFAVAAVSLAIWLLAYGAVRATGAAGGRGGAIATLFTETTLLSLGGAYAVVPWALDESVDRGWLEPDERFDALAMGEATPGPLILVVTFIGFLAGWRGTGASPAVMGLEGAGVATLFAFIPSFAMVLAVAPFVSRIRAGSRLGRAMTAVGAAVVAAIVLLAIALAKAALLPDGTPAPLPILVTIASAAALLRGWATTPVVVAFASATGVAFHWLTG